LIKDVCNRLKGNKKAIIDIGGNVNAIPPIIQPLLDHTGVDYITLQKATTDEGTEKGVDRKKFDRIASYHGFTCWQNN